MSAPTPQVSATTAPPSAAQQAATAQAVSSTNNGTVSMSSTISSLNQLKAESPKLYNAMMQGIAESMINEMQESNDQLVKTIREGEQAYNE